MTMRALLILCTLLLASPVLAQIEVSGQPSGEGNPEDMVCRRPMPIPGKRLLGPKVCKTNAVWAQYREDGMTVSEDGTRDIPAKTSQACRAQGGIGSGGGGGGSARGLGASIVCE